MLLDVVWCVRAQRNHVANHVVIDVQHLAFDHISIMSCHIELFISQHNHSYHLDILALLHG